VSVVLALAAEASVIELVAVNPVAAASSVNPVVVQPVWDVAEMLEGLSVNIPALPSLSLSVQPEPPASLKS
jgi:hypothetical protein